MALMVAMTLSSCGGTTATGLASSSATAAQTGSSLLNSVLGNIIGKVTTFKKANLIGTWTYQGADCKFESESLLAQAGGEVAAATLKTKVNDTFSKIGIKQGSSTFTFNEDGTYVMTVGSRKISGNYTFDESTSKITMTGTFGLTKSEAVISHSTTSNISLLYDADKAMSLVTGLTSKLGALSSSAGTISTLLGKYDGAKVGFSLSK